MTIEMALGILGTIALTLLGWVLQNTVAIKAKVADLDARINGMPMTVIDIRQRIAIVETKVSDLQCQKAGRCQNYIRSADAESEKGNYD